MTDILQTTVVGSYPQPDWLVDRDVLKSHSVPRVRMRDMWRVSEPFLEAAQDDATILAIRDMERAGIDIISDGEIRRESYSNRFATVLDGVDIDNPHEHIQKNGLVSYLPRVVGKIRRIGPVEVRDLEFLRKNTDRKTKITLPGPFTMAQQAHNEHYDDIEELLMDLAAAVNAEAKDLAAAGADVIQLDEPWLRHNVELAERCAVKVLNRALEGITATTALHLCFGYAHLVKGKPSGYSFLPQLADTTAQQISIEAAQPKIDLGVLRELAPKTMILGVIDLGDAGIETPETVAGRIRTALEFITPDRLIPAPDCGMKYMPRETAFGKLKSLAEGAAIVRRELS
ncbi:uroporphyrinogen decarboxylase family protein [Aquabacter sp. CN5-332]|uniref:uroporphyrinogen decarboxylase family protein n=1 Tax=Aquabacter sp. CN5-332 TaxID=3156608 RepID=UPI0032B53077